MHVVGQVVREPRLPHLGRSLRQRHAPLLATQEPSAKTHAIGHAATGMRAYPATYMQ